MSVIGEIDSQQDSNSRFNAENEESAKGIKSNPPTMIRTQTNQDKRNVLIIGNDGISALPSKI
jgi:hypothetical protein